MRKQNQWINKNFFLPPPRILLRHRQEYPAWKPGVQ